MLLTDEIRTRLDLFKGKDVHIDLTRLSFDRKSSANIQQDESEDEISVIKQFIDKTENDENKKELLLTEGVRLLDLAKV